MTRVETKLIELKEIIEEKRKWAFAEADSPLSTNNHQRRMISMVNAYDVCLIEIHKLLNKNKGEILKGGE